MYTCMLQGRETFQEAEQIRCKDPGMSRYWILFKELERGKRTRPMSMEQNIHLTRSYN